MAEKYVDIAYFNFIQCCHKSQKVNIIDFVVYFSQEDSQAPFKFLNLKEQAQMLCIAA